MYRNKLLKWTNISGRSNSRGSMTLAPLKQYHSNQPNASRNHLKHLILNNCSRNKNKRVGRRTRRNSSKAKTKSNSSPLSLKCSQKCNHLCKNHPSLSTTSCLLRQKRKPSIRRTITSNNNKTNSRSSPSIPSKASNLISMDVKTVPTLSSMSPPTSTSMTVRTALSLRHPVRVAFSPEAAATWLL